MSTPDTSLGARVARKRYLAMMTQLELANLLNVGRSTISSLESGGRCNMSAVTRRKLERWVESADTPTADVTCVKCGAAYEVRLVPR